MGWFAYEPEWYDMRSKNFAQSEAQSVSSFAQFLMNERIDNASSDPKVQARENGGSLSEGVWLLFFHVFLFHLFKFLYLIRVLVLSM